VNVTIKDVADHAGVSVTTASYAINGKGTISEATRKRVLRAAEELNYHPNAFARNLKRQKSGTIGVFISRFGGLFYEDILDGIHDTVLDTDFELIVCPESRPINKHLTQRQVDGAIVFDSKISSKLLQNIASERLPLIVLDRNIKSPYIFPILLDNQAGAKAILEHLYARGARRIYYLTGASDSFDNKERMRTFVKEAKKKGVIIQVFKGNFTQEAGYDLGKLTVRSKDLPEAIFCANDQMAIGFIEAMHECSIRVPEEVSVVGFDDIAIAQYMQPALTTVGYSRFAWGQQAAKQLIDYIAYGTPIQSGRIPVTLIERESTRIIRHSVLEENLSAL
jgi:LacI family transcriptional regulator